MTSKSKSLTLKQRVDLLGNLVSALIEQQHVVAFAMRGASDKMLQVFEDACRRHTSKPKKKVKRAHRRE